MGCYLEIEHFTFLNIKISHLPYLRINLKNFIVLSVHFFMDSSHFLFLSTVTYRAWLFLIEFELHSLFVSRVANSILFKIAEVGDFLPKKLRFITTRLVLLHFYVVMNWQNIAKWPKLAIFAFFNPSKIADLAIYRHSWQQFQSSF